MSSRSSSITASAICVDACKMACGAEQQAELVSEQRIGRAEAPERTDEMLEGRSVPAPARLRHIDVGQVNSEEVGETLRRHEVGLAIPLHVRHEVGVRGGMLPAAANISSFPMVEAK